MNTIRLAAQVTLCRLRGYLRAQHLECEVVPHTRILHPGKIPGDPESDPLRSTQRRVAVRNQGCRHRCVRDLEPLSKFPQPRRRDCYGQGHGRAGPPLTLDDRSCFSFQHPSLAN